MIKYPVKVEAYTISFLNILYKEKIKWEWILLMAQSGGFLYRN